jgi:hypothetical protein
VPKPQGRGPSGWRVDQRPLQPVARQGAPNPEAAPPHTARDGVLRPSCLCYATDPDRSRMRQLTADPLLFRRGHPTAEIAISRSSIEDIVCVACLAARAGGQDTREGCGSRDRGCRTSRFTGPARSTRPKRNVSAARAPVQPLVRRPYPSRGTCGYARILLSSVASEIPRTRAVATIIWSAGSR